MHHHDHDHDHDHDLDGKQKGTGGPLTRIRFVFTRFLQSILLNPQTRKIFFFLLLNLTFTVVEALYGVWTNSLGLTSDAVHMLFDSTAIIFSLVASVVARWKANDRFTYGYSRVETLTGFVNATAILFAGCSIIWESVERISEPPEIKKDNLLIVAILGLLVNLVGIFAFDHGGMHHGHGHDHHNHHHGHGHGHGGHDNPLMQGMFLHILADTLGSVGVITSSVLIELYGWTWADPLCSLFIAIMILYSTWPLLKGSAMTLLQRIPFGVDKKLPEVYQKILAIPGVLNYHTPHIWEMSSGQVIATIHIRMIPAGDDQRILFAVEDIFKTALGCSSQCVIQIEREGANNSSGGGGGVGHRKQSLSHFEEIHPKIAPAHSTLNIGFEMHHHQNNNNNDSINANFIHHPSLHHHHHHPSSNHTH